MLSDVGRLVLALVAIRFAARPATPDKTFGYVRFEVLPALANAVVLLLLTVDILYEAHQRCLAPPEILSGPVLVVAFVGLAVNLVSMRFLHAGSKESLNLKGTYFEVLADMLGSVWVILAAGLILLTGWTLADPIIGAVAGLFIVPRAWILLKGAINILMEGTPAHVDIDLLERRLCDLPGVTAIHDLHVWTLTSGLDAMSCHLVQEDLERGHDTLRVAQRLMRDNFAIAHTTIQIEDAALREAEGETHG